MSPQSHSAMGSKHSHQSLETPTSKESGCNDGTIAAPFIIDDDEDDGEDEDPPTMDQIRTYYRENKDVSLASFKEINAYIEQKKMVSASNSALAHTDPRKMVDAVELDRLSMTANIEPKVVQSPNAYAAETMSPINTRGLRADSEETTTTINDDDGNSSNKAQTSQLKDNARAYPVYQPSYSPCPKPSTDAVSHERLIDSQSFDYVNSFSREHQTTVGEGKELLHAPASTGNIHDNSRYPLSQEADYFSGRTCHTQPTDLSPYPTDTSPCPNIHKRRLENPFADVPRPKRCCRTKVEKQKAGEAREAVSSCDSLEKKGLGHTFPRNCRDKEWEIEDLDDVDMAEDGSVWCTVKWKPTRLNAKTLAGAAENRLRELFTEKYGAEAWEMLMTQSTAGRRGRGKKRRADES